MSTLAFSNGIQNYLQTWHTEIHTISEYVTVLLEDDGAGLYAMVDIYGY